ncbi:hypothetical protein MAC_08878 [Metarhizium acridum CQMa 102]|uniref:Uncharacterized protein n=1 Tax=Metarhizium acridum (strain CQMa 102) TaxID=655827 RepID=E9EG80_METAQ|nr:uncharacterized protein MAC_08878 [Metarhizium acridum CQMa 102]EFY85071.1 hypothetical protein MAC_08878 [Metarhizium acridum CQMa 102]
MLRVHMARLFDDRRNKTNLQYSTAQHNYHLNPSKHYAGAGASYRDAAVESHPGRRYCWRRGRRSRCWKKKMLTAVGRSAALALIGGSISFLIRRQKTPASSSQSKPSLAIASEPHGGNGTGGAAHGYLAKPEAANIAGSNASPYASSPSSPTPVYYPCYMDQRVMPQPQFQAQPDWYQSTAHEMPTTKPERQAQELPEAP